jgi:adenine-specific DNA-methyltransferase
MTYESGSNTVPRKKNSESKSTPVTAIRHTEKRANIPTDELSDFVAEDEKHPKTVLYPRDPSLDPQLVWKGKDEQDSHDLAVPAVPVYIQEKIHPQAIIENVRAEAKKGAPQQASLFSDFNGIAFEELIEFYKHEQNWSNRMILGDSLLVMTSLAEKERLKGQVQMIYIDPPYGIKFGSNWQVSTRKRDVRDGKAEDATRQPEQIKAFRDTWELGISSYLAYMRDRLVVARDLLTESGSLFVQINSENSHLVNCILDEVFGSENFVANIIFRKKSLPLGAKYVETMHDHLLLYAKDIKQLKYRQLFDENDVSQITSHGPFAMFPDLSWKKIDVPEFKSKDHPKGTKYYRLFSTIAPSYSAQTDFPFDFEGKKYSPPSRGAWVVDKEKLNKIVASNRLQEEGSSLSYRLFYEDFPYKKITNFWLETAMSYEKIYVVQTTPDIIARCLLMTTDPGDLVLDPTCGSGTTAYVAEQWGRRWITIDTSRVAIALARTRLMAARYPYYLLADTPDGARMEAESAGHLPNNGQLPTTSGQANINRGFVYKRVPHVTLKSIANNEEIDAIHAKWQEQLEPIRAKINKQFKQNWEEWEIPRDLTGLKDPSGLGEKLLAEWWKLRRERQQEIDASIAKRADTELLYDQPYEDNKRIRVAGPFTVESLSPHRVLAAEEERPATEAAGQAETAQGFVQMIIDNLKTAGVQNTIKKERLKFERLEPFAGEWIHATGEYSEGGKTRRVAVSVGPEHGTVGKDQIKEAAKEAVQGIGFDLLIVCGFAFDPLVNEEAKRYGNMTVLITHMNPDLSMGDELLKKTGAANLFMVFGEPDIDIKKQKDGRLVMSIRGVDVYDPTTGEIRSHSTDEIACWFIDTDYNGESFFVRHAYFTGADQPYEKLKRALRAEVDEAAWSALYSTKSLPFDPPAKGKIAVKVINHYGDEVMKVYEVK